MPDNVAAASKATVLLVQSAQTQGNSTRRFLEHSRYDVIWAGSGISALMSARNQHVDLILLDFALPDIEGSELCRRFRARDATRDIPIILLTARGSAPESFSRPPQGPDDYLAKPYTESELDGRIMAVLNARAAAEATRVEQPGAVAPQPAPDNGQVPAEPATPHEKAAAAPAQRSNAGRDAKTAPAPQVAVPDAPRPQPGRTSAAGERTGVLQQAPASGEGQQQPLPAPPHPVPQAAVRTETKQEAAQVRPPSPAQPALPQQTVQGDPPAMPPAQLTPLAAPAVQPAGQPEGQHPAPAPDDEVVDAATGLFSRRQFEAMFSKEFKRSVRFKQQMSCMMIDLDGRAVGRTADAALVKAIIGLVQTTIREVDTAAVWTGDAFIVLLPNTIRNDAVQAGMRVLEAVAVHPFSWPDATRITMSIGVAGMPDKNIDTEQKMIESARKACARARDWAGE